MADGNGDPKNPNIQELEIIFTRINHLDILALTIRAGAVALWGAAVGIYKPELSGTEPMQAWTLLIVLISIALVFWFMEARVRRFYEKIGLRLKSLTGSQTLPANGAFRWHLVAERGSGTLLEKLNWFFHPEQSLFHTVLIAAGVILFSPCSGWVRVLLCVSVFALVAILVFAIKRRANGSS